VHLHAAGRLPQLVGLQHAKRLLLLGEDLPAKKALSLHLVSEIAEDPLARASELAKELSLRPSRSLAAIKTVIESSTFPLLEQSLAAEMDAASWCFADKKSTEAYAKFKARKPDGPTFTSQATTGRDTAPVVAPGSHRTLVDALQHTAASRPDAVFLRFGRVDTTYGQFLADVKLQADGLLKAGIVAGDVIAAMMSNCEEMVILWFAAMWIGAIWAPLHVSATGQL